MLSFKAWDSVLQSKNRTKGNLQMGCISYHFLHIKLPPIAKFPAIVPTFSRDIKTTLLLESYGKVP